MIDKERGIHSIKTALGCLAAYLVTKAIHFPVDQWIIITVIVVMSAQINVGSVLQKSYMRFLGTLLGSLLAAITLSIFGKNPIALASMMGFSAILFSYIATGQKTYSDAGTLGAVTVAIILFGQHPSVTTAAERFLEISIGILIAALVSQFILPIQARAHLLRMQATTMEQFRTYYIAILMTEPSDEVIQSYRELDEKIVKSLSTQRSLAKQSSREFFGDAFDPHRFSQLLRYEKEIFRSMICMHYAYKMIPSGKNSLAELPAVQHFHEAIIETFAKMAPCMEKQNLGEINILIPSLHPIKEAINDARAHTTSDDLIYMDGFLFCADILIITLTELVTLLRQNKKL